MASRNKKNSQAIDGELIPAAATPKQIKLSSIRDVRIEMAAVYREVRSGKMEAQTATRLTYVLTAIANAIRDHELEKRLEKLEQDNEKYRNTHR
jgi:hypothetical protein